MLHSADTGIENDQILWKLLFAFKSILFEKVYLIHFFHIVIRLLLAKIFNVETCFTCGTSEHKEMCFIIFCESIQIAKYS